MPITYKAIQKYAEEHTSKGAPLLRQIEDDTHRSVMHPNMLSGHLQGRLLAMLSKMIAPKCILEIGTYTGYATLCLAEGLAPGGKLITLDINEELEERTRDYFKKANLSSVIDYRIGDARTIIPSLSGPFDMVFIDADKKNYYTYYEQTIDKVPSGGYIIVDNVLWKGKVVDPSIKDSITQSIREFNNRVIEDKRIENILLPVRDGITVIEKK